MPHGLYPYPGSFPNCRSTEGESVFFIRSLNKKLRGKERATGDSMTGTVFRSTYVDGGSLEDPDLVEAALSYVQLI